MDEAIALFSGYDRNKSKEFWLVKPAEEVVEKYKEAIAHLETTMNSMGLDCSPAEVINIPLGENTTDFIKSFKEVQRLALQLDQYVDLPEELQTEIGSAMAEDTLQQFRTAYIDLARRARQNNGDNTAAEPREVYGNSCDDDDIDFELSLFSSALIDYDYIMRLMAKYTGTHFEQVKLTKQQLLDILASSVDLMDERDYLRTFIEEELTPGSGISEEEIRQRYDEFKNRRFNKQIVDLAYEFDLDATALQCFVDETILLRRIDEDVLRELLSNISGWKQRNAAKENLLNRLAPIFSLLTGGTTIEGLNAYLK